MERFLDVNELGINVAAAVQAVFILFWIIPPLAGVEARHRGHILARAPDVCSLLS